MPRARTKRPSGAHDGITSSQRSHQVARHSPRIDAAQFMQTPLFEPFKSAVGSLVAACATKLQKLDARWQHEPTPPKWLPSAADKIAGYCLSQIQDRAVVAAAEAHCSPVDVVLSVTKYHAKYLRRNVYDDVIRLCRVGRKSTENHFHGSFVHSAPERPRCFPRTGDLVSVLCNGTETAAMVLADNGCYHTVTVRQAVMVAGGWQKIIYMQHSDFPDTTQHYRPQDPRGLSGVALQNQVVYYTANGLDNCEGTMQVGRISSVRGPGQYEVTWDVQVTCLLHTCTTPFGVGVCVFY